MRFGVFLACTTARDFGNKPFAQANRFFEGGELTVWSVRMPAEQFAQGARERLIDNSLYSAAVLREPLPPGQEWAYFEWRGKLLVEMLLVEAVLPGQGWRFHGTADGLHAKIFVPMSRDDGEDFDEVAARYRDLLTRDARGWVILRRDWIESPQMREELFGEYADPEIGGAIALLSLSGAARAETDEIRLRTPAEIGLALDHSRERLSAKTNREALRVHCAGFSNRDDLLRLDNFRTAREQWREVFEEVCSSTPTGFFIALELDASRDPTITIQRGTVFEHQSLTTRQTLATMTQQRTIVDAGEVVPLIIPAYCLNRELAPPNGNLMRPTPFIFQGATGTQEDVWRLREIV